MKELFINETGTDYDTLKDILKDIDESTELLDINTVAMTVFSPIAESKKNPDAYVMYKTSGKADDMSRKGTLCVTEYKEMIKNHSDSVLKIGDSYMAASENCMYSIYTRLGVTGDALGLKYEKEEDREYYISKRDDFVKVLMETGVEGKLLYRKNDAGSKRALHMFSPKGEHILQSNIIELIDYISSQMGAAPDISYDIKDDLTCVWVSYPDKADDYADDKGVTGKIIPGVYIETSDTGECALTLRGTEKIQGRIMYSGIVRRVHKGKFDIDEFKTNFDKKIFPEYLKYPKRFIDLALINVSDVSAYIDALYEQTPLGAVLGRQKVEIKNLVMGNLSQNVTALAVILEFINFSNNVKVVTREKENKLAEALTAAMFTDITVNAFSYTASV